MVQSALVNGLIGGVVATIVMSVFQMALGPDSPPPTALFWSKYVGDGPPEEYMPQGMALHFLYGIGAGAVFAVALFLGAVTLSSTVIAVAYGLAYGVVLFVIAAVFWMNVVLDLDADPKTAGMFLFFHLIYGAVLGAWLEIGLVSV